jgi:hypothetical protein
MDCVLAGAELHRARPLNSVVIRGGTMSKSDPSFTAVILAVMLGAAIAFVCVPLYGITAAIPGPTEYFQWARNNGQTGLALLSWNTAVVAGLALGIPAFIGLVVLCRAFPRQTFGVILGFGAAIEIGRYVLVPLAYFDPPSFMLNRAWYSYADELALVIAIALAWLSTRITRRSSGP